MIFTFDKTGDGYGAFVLSMVRFADLTESDGTLVFRDSTLRNLFHNEEKFPAELKERIRVMVTAMNAMEDRCSARLTLK